MLELAVVGAGFWGSAVYSRSDHGTAALFDGQRLDGASRNAAGIVDWGWYEGSTVKGMLPDWWDSRVYLSTSMAYLNSLGSRRYDEEFYSYQRPERRLRGKVELISSPSAAMVEPTVPHNVMAIVEHGRWWELKTAFGDFEARRLVIAAGAWTDELLLNSGLQRTGVRKLRGRALVAEVDSVPDRVVTYLAAPYRHYTLRPMGDAVRLGDTVERSPGNKPLSDLRKLLKKMAPGSKELAVMDGMRPVLPQMVVERIRPGLVVATGGHRVGLGMAGGIAKRALELL